jgi:predicted phosphodiesterase
MRIAAVSDIHGNLPALRAVMADIARRGADVVVNLGDILSGPLLPAETADFLIGLDLPTIKGNHERQVLTHARERMGASDAYAADRIADRHRAWLAGLPPTMWLADDVFLCHGAPGGDLVYFLEQVDADGGVHAASPDQVQERAGDCPARLILCGHTHTPRAVRLGDGRLVVNPGSVGLQAYFDDNPVPHNVEIGSPQARYAIIDKTAAGWRAELIAVDYDFEPVAALAQANGRPDWAVALRTGRMS